LAKTNKGINKTETKSIMKGALRQCGDKNNVGYAVKPNYGAAGKLQ
jgi:hypothetical protein